MTTARGDKNTGKRDNISSKAKTAKPTTHVEISLLVNKMCSQQACSKLVNKL